MRLLTLREELVAFGKKLLSAGLTTGTGGNLSAYDRSCGVIAMTPSGLDYLKTTAADIVLMDPDGQIIECRESVRPTSEWELHLAIYRSRPDVSAVVHTHSLYATAIACTGSGIRTVHYLAAMGGRSIRCTPYETYGTPELAQICARTLENDHAVLLGNHGVICVGPDLPDAFARAEHIEYVAHLQVITDSLGGARLLNEEQMQAVRDRFGTNPYR